MKTPQWIAASRLRICGITLRCIAKHGGFSRNEFYVDLSHRPNMMARIEAAIDDLKRKMK